MDLLDRVSLPVRSPAALARRVRAARSLGVSLGPDPIPQRERRARLACPVGKVRAAYYAGRDLALAIG